MAQRSIAEQLQPLARDMFRRVPRQFSMVQVMADLVGSNVEDSVAEARRQVLIWLQNRSGRLPESAWTFDDFELPTPGTPSAGVHLKSDDLDYWAVRLDYMDESVPGRTWVTEAAVASGPASRQAMFGLRLSVSTREQEPLLEPSVPGVVRQLIEAPGLTRNGRSIEKQPWIINDVEEVEGLIGLIEDPRRRRPVFVVSLPEGENSPTGAVIDPFDLSVRCAGIAHVILLGNEPSFVLTNRVGKLFSVFRGAVRTYLPNCDLVADSPYDHPLALPERIDEWRGKGPSEFVLDLARRAAKESLFRIKGEQELPSFTTVKQASLSLKREQAADAGRSDTDLLALAEAEIKELKNEADGWLAYAQSEEERRTEAEVALEEIKASSHWLRERVDELEGQRQLAVGGGFEDEVPIPKILNELKPWAEKYLPGLVKITGRAARAAKGSDYEDVELACKSVSLLARQYRNMRLGFGREPFEQQCRKLGIECSLTHAGSRAGEEGDEYFVNHLGRRRYLDTHLKKGGSRETRHSLRVYFFWDDENRQVVIGSMPGHLTTRIS